MMIVGLITAYIILAVIGIIVTIGFYKMFKSIQNSIKRDFKYYININKKSYLKCKLPIVKAKFKDRDIYFLVDTGSNTNIINEDFVNLVYKDTGIPETKDAKVSGLATKENLCKSIVEEISFDCYNSETECEKFNEQFLILDMNLGVKSDLDKNTGLDIQGMLGNEFFQKARWIIDLDQLVVWVKK